MSQEGEYLDVKLKFRILELAQTPKKYVIKVPNTYINRIETATQIFIQKIKDLTNQDLINFIVQNHVLMKIATGQILFINEQNYIEIIVAKSIKPDFVKKWISSKDVKSDELLIHPHVMSNMTKKKLIDFGLGYNNIKREREIHWDRSYWEEILRASAQICANNNQVQGIVIDGSWILSPKLYDFKGKSIVHFDFLNTPLMYGERILIPKEQMDPIEYEKQQKFFSTSPFREDLLKNNEFNVDVYAMFYSKETLIERFRK